MASRVSSTVDQISLAGSAVRAGEGFDDRTAPGFAHAWGRAAPGQERATSQLEPAVVVLPVLPQDVAFLQTHVEGPVLARRCGRLSSGVGEPATARRPPLSAGHLARGHRRPTAAAAGLVRPDDGLGRWRRRPAAPGLWLRLLLSSLRCLGHLRRGLLTLVVPAADDLSLEGASAEQMAAEVQDGASVAVGPAAASPLYAVLDEMFPRSSRQHRSRMAAAACAMTDIAYAQRSSRSSRAHV